MADGDQNWVKFPDGRYYPYDKSVPDSQILDDMEKMRQTTGGAKEAKEAKEEGEGGERVPPVPGAAAARSMFRGGRSAGGPPVPGAETAQNIYQAAKHLYERAITPPPPKLPAETPRPKETMSREPSFMEKLEKLAQQGPFRMGEGEAPPAYENMTQEGRAEHPILARVGDITRGAKEWGRIPYEMMPLIPGVGWEAKEATLPRAGMQVNMLENAAPIGPARPGFQGEMPRVTPPIGSSEADLDAATRRMFPNKTFGELSQEDKMRVMRGYGGGAEPPVERRKVDIGAPVMEQRGVPQGTMPAVGGPERRATEPAPYTGPERRTLSGSEIYRMSPYSQPTEGEKLAEQIRISRAGQAPGISEGEAQAEIMRNPAEWDKFATADRKGKDQMLIAAKNRLVAAKGGPGTLPTATPENVPPAPPVPQGATPQGTMPTVRPPQAGPSLPGIRTEQELAEAARRAGTPKEVP